MFITAVCVLFLIKQKQNHAKTIATTHFTSWALNLLTHCELAVSSQEEFKIRSETSTSLRCTQAARVTVTGKLLWKRKALWEVSCSGND